MPGAGKRRGAACLARFSRSRCAGLLPGVQQRGQIKASPMSLLLCAHGDTDRVSMGMYAATGAAPSTEHGEHVCMHTHEVAPSAAARKTSCGGCCRIAVDTQHDQL